MFRKLPQMVLIVYAPRDSEHIPKPFSNYTLLRHHLDILKTSQAPSKYSKHIVETRFKQP